MACKYQCWPYLNVCYLPLPHTLTRFIPFFTKANTILTLFRSAYGADGKAVPIGSTTIAGTKWNVYKGPNGAMTVFSFLPADGSQIKSFNGDVNLFFQYLTKSQGLPATQYLKSIGAGTEPTLGSKAVFTTNGYSVKVNYA
jgi:hypothetical protein